MNNEKIWEKKKHWMPSCPSMLMMIIQMKNFFFFAKNFSDHYWIFSLFELKIYEIDNGFFFLVRGEKWIFFFHPLMIIILICLYVDSFLLLLLLIIINFHCIKCTWWSDRYPDIKCPVSMFESIVCCMNLSVSVLVITTNDINLSNMSFICGTW